MSESEEALGAFLKFDDINQVVADLASVKDKWREIGTQIGLQETALIDIQSKHSDPLDRLRAVVSVWVSTWRATRRILINALMSSKVGEPHLAAQLTANARAALGPKETKVGVANQDKGRQSVGTSVTGLKRKELHNEVEDAPVLRKKLKVDNSQLYDPPSYDIKDFVSTQPPHLQCVSCKRVPRRPLQLMCCNTLYCGPCSDNVKTCPVHNKGAEFKGDTALRTKISKLTVHCANCKSKSAIYQMKDHLLICPGKPSSSTTSRLAQSSPLSATSGEPMDISVGPVSQISKTSAQVKLPVDGGTSKLERAPLQQTGVKTGKDQSKPVNISSSRPQPQLPTLAEVKPSNLPTLSQLRSTLTQVMAIVNANKGQASSTEPPIDIPTLKLPGGKELQINVTPTQLKEMTTPLTGAAPVINTKVGPSLGTASKNTTSQGNSTLQTVAKPSATLVLASTPSAPIMSVTTPAAKLSVPVSAVSSKGTASVATPLSSAASTSSNGDIASLKIGSAFSMFTTASQPTAVTSTTSTSSTAKPSQAHKDAKLSSKVAAPEKKSAERFHVIKLSEVEKELAPIATKWRKLGRALDQTDSTLATLATALGKDSSKCLSALLVIVFNSTSTSGYSGAAQWKSMLKALSKDIVGEKGLADSLVKKYGSNVRIVSDNMQVHTRAATKAATKPQPVTVSRTPSTSAAASIGRPKSSTHTSLPSPANTTVSTPVSITLVSAIPVVSANVAQSVAGSKTPAVKLSSSAGSSGVSDLVAKLQAAALPALQNTSGVPTVSLNNSDVSQLLLQALKAAVTASPSTSNSKTTARDAGKTSQGTNTVNKQQSKTTRPKTTSVPVSTTKSTVPSASVSTTAKAPSTPGPVVTSKALTTPAPVTPPTGSIPMTPPTGSTLGKAMVTKSPKSVSVEISKVKVNGTASSVAAKPAPAEQSNSATKRQQNSDVVVPDSQLITLAPEDFVAKPRREVHCSKCSHIPLNPKRPKCSCNVVYCTTCANAVPSCPLCGKREGFEEDKVMRKRIWNLQVPCAYKAAGCDWRGLLSKRTEHTSVCTKRSFPCKYSVLGCEAMLKLSEMDSHTSDERDNHFQLAVDKVMELVEEVKVLKDKIEKLQK